MMESMRNIIISQVFLLCAKWELMVTLPDKYNYSYVKEKKL